MLFYCMFVAVLVTTIHAEMKWNVKVYTLNEKYADTNGNIHIDFYGTKGQSLGHLLDDHRNNFERGQIDEFDFITHDIGEPTRIQLHMDDSSTGWGLNKIEVIQLKPNVFAWVFQCNCWLMTTDKGSSRTIRVTETPCPSGGWLLYFPDRSCIKTFDSKLSFDEAKMECIMQSGSLVKVRSEEKNEFVIATINEAFNGRVQSTWIGVTQHDGTYKLINHEYLSYKPWWSGYPTPDKDGCGQMMLRGGWITWWCHMEEAYTCQTMAKVHGIDVYLVICSNRYCKKDDDLYLIEWKCGSI